MSFRIRFSACLLAALPLVPALARAQEKKPAPSEISGDIGLVDVSGNTAVRTFSGNERWIRRIGLWEFKQDFGTVYGKTDGVESSNLWRAGLRSDFALGPHLALYALTAFDRNKFAGIKSRYAEGVGAVAKLIVTDVNQFNVEGGFQATQQQNLDGGHDNFPSLRGASTWKHAFSKAAYFFQGVEVLPNLEDHEDVRVNTETTLAAPLSTHVGMKFSYVVRFDNAPALNLAGTAPLEKSDRIFSAGIQVSY